MAMKKTLLTKTILIGSLIVSHIVCPAIANAESQIISSGKFEGRSNHITTGGITILKTDDETLVLLESSFSFDGAPDPKLGFGNDGNYDPASKFSALRKDKGAQVYTLPNSINPGKYNEIWVWCEKFNVPLGVAPLKK